MAAPVSIETYKEIMLVLATAGVVVPAMSRLKVSPVVGFLVTGIVMGPHGLSRLAADVPVLGTVTISDVSEFPAFAELGILLLMFLIGIELSFNRLMTMRRMIFGLGGVQVVGSIAVIACLSWAFGLSAQAALLIGAAFSLSSTAIIIEELALRKRLNAPVGRAAFAILLKQDLAVIPLIILAGLLARPSAGTLAHELGSALASGVAAILVLLVIGHVLFKPILRLVVASHSPDMFLAAVLAIVIGAGMTASSFGLSMALGGFAAGLLLAETEYRRMIESIIEPFKGILLGVFFISVGFEIDPLFILAHLPTLLALVAGVILAKALVVFPAARLFGLSSATGLELGLMLGPAGEFAFVLLTIASGGGLLTQDQHAVLMSAVALGMMGLPVLVVAGERLTQLVGTSGQALDVTGGSEAVAEGGAIIIGGGRVGSLVSALLLRHQVAHLMVDSSPLIVRRKRQDGIPIFYGDATHPEFLRKCGIARAKTLIVTVNDPKKAEAIAALVHQLKPGIQLIVRAHDESHARKLYRLGADVVIPETYEASLQLSEASLLSLGLDPQAVSQTIDSQRASLDNALRAP